MRIMICSDLAPPYIGGAESYVINLGSRLVKLGHNVYWLTSRLPATKHHEIYKGIHILRVPIFFSKKYLSLGRKIFPFTAFLPIIKLAKKMDILQFNTYPAGILGWFVSKLSKKPSLLWCHEFFGQKWKKLGQNPFESKVYPSIEKFIASLPYDWFACPSHYSKKTIIRSGAPERKISVIHHGIDHTIFKPNVKSNLREKFNLDSFKLFGYTGRLSLSGTGQSKGLLTLLKATKYVASEIEDIRLVLGGYGFDQLKPYIEKFRIKNFVIYTGLRSFKEVPKFYSMCDVVAGASEAEGFGFMYAEASSCGKPVVAPRSGSIPEIIKDGETGILVPTGNAKALAKAIIKLLIDRKRAKQMGEKGAKYSKKFRWKTSVNKHLKIYKRLAE